MPEEVGSDQAQPQKYASLSEAVDISRDYGGLDKIPDTVLNNIGFRRAGENIVPLEGYVLGGPEAKRLNNYTEKTFEQKTREAPFGEIQIELNGREVPFRRLSDDQITYLERRVRDTVELLEDSDGFRFLPQNLAFQTFAKRFFIKDKEIDPEDEHYAKEDVLYFGSMALVKGLNEHLQSFDHAISPYIDEGENGYVMSSSNAEDFYQELERMKGSLGDQTQLDRKFEELQDEEFEDHLAVSFEQYCQNRSLTTYFDVGTHFFGRFLEAYDLHEISESIQDCESIDDVRKVLEESKGKSLQVLLEEEKRLREELRNASLDEKMSLSGELKKIKGKKEDIKTIIEGMIQYYDAPSLVSEVVNRKIKEIQDFLIGGVSKEEDLTFFLNGTPDKNLDQDPGRISGDCTEGAPLPFADSNFPIYNVKVLSSDKHHIGNIYLLKTLTEDGRETWHLDAIQIPDYRINWDDSIPVIIEAIGNEAKKKNVSVITVNEDSETTSNYDYIADAVDDYWEEVGRGWEDIQLPARNIDENRYSYIQSTGRARVVWRNGEDKSG